MGVLPYQIFRGYQKSGIFGGRIFWAAKVSGTLDIDIKYQYQKHDIPISRGTAAACTAQIDSLFLLESELCLPQLQPYSCGCGLRTNLWHSNFSLFHRN
jgi:hypothetical protein